MPDTACFDQPDLKSVFTVRVTAPAGTVSEAIANFGITYAKGAAPLRQLSTQAGEERFTAGLRADIARHSYGNARQADLLASVSAASGKNLIPWSTAGRALRARTLPKVGDR
jgi:aminopeptidase N